MHLIMTPKSFEYRDLVDFLPESLWTAAWYTKLAKMEDIRNLAKHELLRQAWER